MNQYEITQKQKIQGPNRKKQNAQAYGQENDNTTDLLLNYSNLLHKFCIIQGPPGTGKSKVASAIVYHIIEKCKNSKIEEKNEKKNFKENQILKEKQIEENNTEKLMKHDEIKKNNIRLKNFFEIEIVQEIIKAGECDTSSNNDRDLNLSKARARLESLNNGNCGDDTFTRRMINQKFCNFQSNPKIKNKIVSFNKLEEEIAMPFMPIIDQSVYIKKFPKIQVDYNLEDKILVCASSNTAVTTLRKFITSKGLFAIQIYTLKRQSECPDDPDSLHY